MLCYIFRISVSQLRVAARCFFLFYQDQLACLVRLMVIMACNKSCKSWWLSHGAAWRAQNGLQDKAFIDPIGELELDVMVNRGFVDQD